jgi:hypothetical protein
MDAQDTLLTSPAKRKPWNKGKFTGAKPPLRPKHVWSIRSKLQAEGRTRDLAMFILVIDSKLRACNVVALKVEDVAPNSYAADRATIRQRKTVQGRTVKPLITPSAVSRSMRFCTVPREIAASSSAAGLRQINSPAVKEVRGRGWRDARRHALR